VAVRVEEYAAPTTPPLSDVVVTLSCVPTISVNVPVAVWGELALSLTVTTTVELPLAVGLPVIAPVEELRESPAGSPVAFQV
jgi:hypothetical protein